MKRDKKDQRIKELNKIFSQQNTFFLLDFKKMTVAQSVDLRKTLHKDSHSVRVVKNRLATYYQQTEPVVEYYRSKRTVHDIDANEDADSAAAVIFRKLDPLAGNAGRRPRQQMRPMK